MKPTAVKGFSRFVYCSKGMTEEKGSPNISGMSQYVGKDYCELNMGNCQLLNPAILDSRKEAGVYKKCI